MTKFSIICPESSTRHRNNKGQFIKESSIQSREVTSRRYRLKAKLECITHYGGKCVCCGESNIKFLTMDHVNNDGAKHRLETNRFLIYAWLRSQGYPEGYQVMCFNCNCGRYYNGGVCPHHD